jgi:hypothetical protein
MRNWAKPLLRVMLVIFTLNLGMMTFSADSFVDDAKGEHHATVADSGRSSDKGNDGGGLVCNHLCHAAVHFLGYMSAALDLFYPDRDPTLLVLQDAVAASFLPDTQFRPPRT